MLSGIEKRLLKGHSTWNYKSKILLPDPFTTSRSVILIHGFIGSPFDLKPVACHLVERGFKVVIPALAGQTFRTNPFHRKKYSKTYYIDWLRRIIDKEAAATGRKPFLLGFSMGGSLATIAAAEGSVDKLVLIAPFYKLANISDRIWQVSRTIAPIIPFVPKISKGRINSKKGYQKYLPGSWLVSTGAFNILGDLAMEARMAAGKINVFCKVFLSDNDKVADSEMTKQLFADRKNVDLIFENRANHILTYDYGADNIIEEIGLFFRSDKQG